MPDYIPLVKVCLIASVYSYLLYNCDGVRGLGAICQQWCAFVRIRQTKLVTKTANLFLKSCPKNSDPTFGPLHPHWLPLLKHCCWLLKTWQWRKIVIFASSLAYIAKPRWVVTGKGRGGGGGGGLGRTYHTLAWPAAKYRVANPPSPHQTKWFFLCTRGICPFKVLICQITCSSNIPNASSRETEQCFGRYSSPVISNDYDWDRCPMLALKLCC